jgi:hypothetical protein
VLVWKSEFQRAAALGHDDPVPGAPGDVHVSSAESDRRLIEAIHEQNLEQERLFRMIAALGNCLDRNAVIETMQRILGVDPVENDDGVLFDDIAVSFDKDGRVKGLYRVIDGSERPTRPAAKANRA